MTSATSSPALRGGGFGQGHQLIRHPGIAGISEARVALDYLILDPASGDFIVDVMGAGWLMREDPHYAAEVFPPGSDSSPDQIIWETPAIIDRLTTRTSTAAAGAWHQLVVTFAADHSMVVELDGAPHMTSAADARTAGPFDIVLHLRALTRAAPRRAAPESGRTGRGILNGPVPIR